LVYRFEGAQPWPVSLVPQPADKLVVVWRRAAGQDDVALGQLLLGYGIIVPRHAKTAVDASEIGVRWTSSCIARINPCRDSQEFATAGRCDVPDSFHTNRSTTNRMPVTAVLIGRPSMFRPETRSPTAVPAARIATTVSQ
jgi:hypothetical protein